MTMFTRITATALAMLMATPLLAQTDLLGIPGPIDFEGESYALVWSSQPSADYIKHEYLPAGQTLDSYTDMLMIEAVAGAITPIQAASAQVQNLEARRASDPVVNHDIIQNEATGEVLLDFVLSDLSADPIIVEWNAYRFMPLADGEGVALFAVSRRGYGDEGARTLLEGLGATRGTTISALAGFAVPAISLDR